VIILNEFGYSAKVFIKLKKLLEKLNFFFAPREVMIIENKSTQKYHKRTT